MSGGPVADIVGVMRTDPATLEARTFDVLVVGGGIQGAAIAREAALRGVDVLLIDRDDYASGTSMRSSRLVHGGVRYLQQGHLSLVREALAERERLLRLAPHLVRPLPMLMPFFDDGGGAHRWLVRFGLRLYSWLARGSTLPRPRYHRPDSCARLFPGIRTRGLHGGSLFYDGRTEDLRLTLAVLQGAVEAGAAACNHLELCGISADGSIELRDRIGDRAISVRARHVFNVAGPALDDVRRKCGIDGDDLVRLSRGSHLVFDPREGEVSLGAFLPDDRIQFVIPHPDGTVCGTTDVDEAKENAHGPPPQEDVDYMLDALAHMLESPPTRDDVRFAYAGWRALPAGRGPSGALNREAFVVPEPAAHDACTVHSVVGGKLTTHRSLAERAVNEVLGIRDASPSRALALPGGDGPREVGDPLWWRHGSRARNVRALAAGQPALFERIAPDRDLWRVEAIYALRTQGAVTFADLMIRRLFHSLGPSIDEASLREMHELYLRERTVEIDRDFDEDRELLFDELARLSGRSTPSSTR